MDLMKNKYLKFKGIEFNGKFQKNITDYNILPDIPEKYFGENYILEFKIEDNRLIESIAFELYETTGYWDILLALNKITNLAQLPVNYDIVLTRAKKSLGKWITVGSFMISRSLTSQYEDIIFDLENGNHISLQFELESELEIIKRKYLELLEEEIEKNEKHRNIKYISISDMSELEGVLQIAKQMPKMNIDLIINKSEIQPIEI